MAGQPRRNAIVEHATDLEGMRKSGLVAWLHRFIDPATSLTEILFGLIMTLTFTLGAGIVVQDEGREGARQLLVAALGCNIAWGIIDAAFYLITQLFEREQFRRIGRRVREVPDEAAAVELLASRFDETLSGTLDQQERQALYQRLARNVRRSAAASNKLRREDWLGALTSGLLVVLVSVPPAIPFLLIDDAFIAMRCSNAILLSLLFATGYGWARYTSLKPALVGLTFLLGGTALVLIAIPLGG
jgi:hypothetical protein